MNDKTKDLEARIKKLQEKKSHCDRSQRFDINQELAMLNNELVAANFDDNMSRNYRMAYRSIENAISSLNDAQKVSPTVEMVSIIDLLEQGMGLIKTEIGKHEQ